MRSDKNTIQIFEHQTLMAHSGSKFQQKHFDALSAYGYKTNEKYYSVGNKRIKFSQYVGVIQVLDLTIEVLPKTDNYDSTESSRSIWRDALIGMLHECRLIKLESITNAKLKLKSASLLDLYFDAFLTQTELLIRQGLRKQYKCVAENLNKVKGRIDFSAHIRKNYLHKERFYVEHKIYTVDNRFNQILLKALQVMRQIISNPKFESRIKRLLLYFETVSDVPITEKSFVSIRYDRNSERYKQAVTLAKLIILRYSPDLRGGNENVLAILFDMNRLYENYIYRKLKVLEFDSSNPIKRVNQQVPKPFWERSYLKADIVIECSSARLVIDTKWKVPQNNRPSDQDVKQMFIYDLHYDSYISILLYPKTTNESLNKKPFKNELFCDRYCQVAYIDLFHNNKTLNKELGYLLYKDLLSDELLIDDQISS